MTTRTGDGRVVEYLGPMLADLVEIRRHLHANPEPSGGEHATTALVAEKLRKRGLTSRLLAVGTGLTCDIGGATHAGRTVALRADIDALAMDDLKDVAYRSRVPGLAHACGHDVHTCIVLGAGLVLADLFEDDPALAARGRVRLVFEPAEESAPGGAVDVIDEGLLDDVDTIFGLHCEPKLDVGKVGVTSGPITSAADMLTIELNGPGGHTARPELTVDLVSVAAMVVDALPRLVAERARSAGDLRVVFGAIHAGDAPNAIPTTAVLRASVRMPDLAAWNRAADVIEDALATIVKPTGASWTIDHRRGVPPAVNDTHATDLLRDAAHAAVGDGVVDATQSWGGDSFAWYLQRVPGSYARLGVHDHRSPEPQHDLHSGVFDVDERSIGIGVRVLVGAALRALTDGS